MIIRAQRTGDAAVVRQLLTSAFTDTGRVADLAETLARRPDRPVPALVAEVRRHARRAGAAVPRLDRRSSAPGRGADPQPAGRRPGSSTPWYRPRALPRRRPTGTPPRRPSGLPRRQPRLLQPPRLATRRHARLQQPIHANTRCCLPARASTLLAALDGRRGRLQRHLLGPRPRRPARPQLTRPRHAHSRSPADHLAPGQAHGQVASTCTR